VLAGLGRALEAPRRRLVGEICWAPETSQVADKLMVTAWAPA
jgi:hypothetical protein